MVLPNAIMLAGVPDDSACIGLYCMRVRKNHAIDRVKRLSERMVKTKWKQNIWLTSGALQS